MIFQKPQIITANGHIKGNLKKVTALAVAFLLGKFLREANLYKRALSNDLSNK